MVSSDVHLKMSKDSAVDETVSPQHEIMRSSVGDKVRGSSIEMKLKRFSRMPLQSLKVQG